MVTVGGWVSGSPARAASQSSRRGRGRGGRGCHCGGTGTDVGPPLRSGFPWVGRGRSGPDSDTGFHRAAAATPWTATADTPLSTLTADTPMPATGAC